jgi:hypothetical protein
VTDEFQRSHRFQQGTVPVAIAIGFLEILIEQKGREREYIIIIIITSRAYPSFDMTSFFSNTFISCVLAGDII